VSIPVMYGRLNFNEYSGDLRKLILSYSMPATLAALLKYPYTIFKNDGYLNVSALSANL